MMKLSSTQTLRAVFLSLPLFGAVSLFAPSFANADEPPVVSAADSADGAVTPESAPSELDVLAEREKAAQLDEFQGGDQVVLTTSGLALILIVVLVVIIVL